MLTYPLSYIPDCLKNRSVTRIKECHRRMGGGGMILEPTVKTKHVLDILC